METTGVVGAEAVRADGRRFSAAPVAVRTGPCTANALPDGLLSRVTFLRRAPRRGDVVPASCAGRGREPAS